jgi:carboxypeptidase family protein
VQRASALIGILVGLAFMIAPLAAQTVTGRVTDSLGVPIPHASILAHPIGDSTEASTRIAVTNAQGEFRVAVAMQAVYAIRVRRIGFVGEKEQTLDLSHAREATLVIVLRAIPLEINAVHIAAKAPKLACLPINDSLQNPIVRDWFDRAVYWIQARRVVERSLSFKVRVVRDVTPSQGTHQLDNQYSHLPGTGTAQWMEDDIASLAGVARTAGAGRDNSVMPTEMTILSPMFRSSYCFVNRLAPNADGTWTMEFRDLVAHANTPAITGSFVFAADGLGIDNAEFKFATNGRPIGSAHLSFMRTRIEGEAYPILSLRSVEHVPSHNNSRAEAATELFTYWAYQRKQ